MGASESVPQKSIHDFSVKDSKGKEVDLSTYKGKVLLVVNVASKCRLADSNYTQLTEVYNQYKKNGYGIFQSLHFFAGFWFLSLKVYNNRNNLFIFV
ncbi:probable glutathione peroxidase 5 isoform X1 [Camellia sinensis]|uniref:probable glutathione peroxidase 5 isoform X1 n=1 Tax=Camellia sinensis TaxID=4442 RepID=UPI001036F0AC|nr:probable glutathione peroxidase 5 isoform X1 [Camellia sinensis]